STPCRPGLAENIQPEKMRFDVLEFSISSTSMKLSVCGASVCGRVRQTRGVICRLPNCTVSSIATSKEMMRPVILSRPAKMAVGLWISSARVAAPANSVAPNIKAREESRIMRARESFVSPGAAAPDEELGLGDDTRGSTFRRPGLIIAGGLRAGAGGQRRTLRTPGVGRAGLVGDIGLFP